MLKKRLALCFTLLAFLLLTACQDRTAQKPEDTLKAYYEALLAGDYDTAYAQLCTADQNTVTLEDFKLWQTLYKETEEIRAYKIGTGKSVKDYTDVSGTRHPKAMEFSVTQTDMIHADGKESSYDYARTLIVENGVWKLSRGETQDIYRHRIYYGYATIGRMYEKGIGRDPDPAKALEMYGKALEYNATDIGLCFETALMHLQSEKPVEAEKYSRMALEANPEPGAASEIQNLLGVSLSMQGRKDEARSAFEEAVKLDPANENAQNNLKNVQ